MTRPPQFRARGRTLTLALLALLALTPGRAGAQPPMPLDPLTAQEEQDAASLAQTDPRVSALLGPGRSVLSSVDFITLQKPPEGTDPELPLAMPRTAQVLFARYEGNGGVRALVDLTGRRVTVVESISGNDVPLNVTELRAAWDLARPNPAVRQVLGNETDFYQVFDEPGNSEPSHRVEGLRIVGTQSNERCFENRCLSLLFQRFDEYISNVEVLVNLTNQTVTVIGSTGGTGGASSHDHSTSDKRRMP